MTGYYAGWSTYETPMSVVLAGSVAGTATVAEDYLSHLELGDASIAGNPYYNPFAFAMQSALDAVSPGFTVTFDSTANAYTISRAGTFSLSFIGTAGTNLQRALGFQFSFYAAALSHTSDATPYYIIAPAYSARGSWSGIYEPDDIVSQAMSDGGQGYAVAKDTTELYCDWVQAMESKEATQSHVATGTAPWTWIHLFKHCRSTHPFTVVDALSDIEGTRIYVLRPDGAAATKDTIQMVSDDWDSLWKISFKCNDVGETP